MEANTLLRLKQAASEAQRRAATAAGVAQAHIKSLEENFGAKTLSEAKAVLAELKEEATKAKEKADKLLLELNNEWGDVLDEYRT